MHIFACELHVSWLKSTITDPDAIPGSIASHHTPGYGPRAVCPR